MAPHWHFSARPPAQLGNLSHWLALQVVVELLDFVLAECTDFIQAEPDIVACDAQTPEQQGVGLLYPHGVAVGFPFLYMDPVLGRGNLQVHRVAGQS